MKRRLIVVLLLVSGVGSVALLADFTRWPPGSVKFSQADARLGTYEILEITAEVAAPRPRNPFTDVEVNGEFELEHDGRRWRVDGFCDADDGSTFRVRFMPSVPGDYRYSVRYRQGSFSANESGTFHVDKSSRRGPIRIDPEHRWHFVWEGTGEHYFFNGTTAYWLMGWRDEQVIRSIIDRLHRLQVNRVRVTVGGRTRLTYGEPVMTGSNWTTFVTPWPVDKGTHAIHLIGRAGQRYGMGFGRGAWDTLANVGLADDIYHPGFDYSRFEVAYWQKFDRALRYARDRDVVISLVLDMNDSEVHPAPGSEDEQRFIRYAIARFGAFSNITWDLGDDLDRYRDDHWTRSTGVLIKQWDPYHHLATSHPVDNAHQDRTADWFDFTSFQEWSRTQHEFMLAQRREQARLGRIIPQTNEEYGYEDHYPMWAKGPGSDAADVLRRMAWEIVMAGGYQTTGESARRGTNIWPDSGGGWMNGRGDDSMTMLQGYAHMVDFFTSFRWWSTEPHDELVSGGNYCLALPGEIYAVYLPRAGSVTVRMQPGRYSAIWWSAATGQKATLPTVEVATPYWESPPAPGSGDWALLLQKDPSAQPRAAQPAPDYVRSTATRPRTPTG